MDNANNDVQEPEDVEAVEEQASDDIESAEEQAPNMEAAEELSEVDTVGHLTGMKLDNSAEEFRSIEPNFPWTYFIEIYPWHDDDMNEKFVKLIRLSEFCRVAMRKKKNSHGKTDAGDKSTEETSNEKINADDEKTEKTKDAQAHKQRMGCLQFYLTGPQTAKYVMRSMCWKSMAAKQLTVEVTRRDPADKSLSFETAYLELNTHPLCKCRYRVKSMGELKDRSTRVSNIPGEITRGFLEVVLTRASPVVKDATDKSIAVDPSQKLKDIEDFKGILDFDCMSRGSARAFVQAHRRVVLNGQELTVVAVDEKTMVEPTQPITDPTSRKSRKTKHKNAAKANLLSNPIEEKGTRGRGARRGQRGARGSIARGSISRGAIGRGPRDLFTSPVHRNGPRMPIETLTGRQKMNRKLQREMGGAGSGSVAQIAQLHTQLTASTMALQENFALLAGCDSYPDMSVLYNDQTIGYNDRIDHYNDLSAGFNDMSSDYDSWSSRGWSDTDNGFYSGHSNMYSQHTSGMGASRGGGGRERSRVRKRRRW